MTRRKLKTLKLKENKKIPQNSQNELFFFETKITTKTDG